MNRKILVLAWPYYGADLLYRDVGGIPYALSRYNTFEATLAYSNVLVDLIDSDYEEFVELDKIEGLSIFSKKNRLGKKFAALKYVWNAAKNYGIINLYHYNNFNRFLCKIAKLRNPNIITYIKMDMGRGVYERELKKKERFLLEFFLGTPDLFTVETKKYAEDLCNTPRFKGKMRYLPNGFFDHLLINDDSIDKENIILTVGRLGTKQKNTELLIEAFIELNKRQNLDYKLYLVGSRTKDFEKWLAQKYEQYPCLKQQIVITGNIVDKKELYEIYSKAKVFVLPSRNESWGLVLNEAMYFKDYCIVTDVCDAYKDFLYDGDKALASVIPSEDTKALVLELEKVVSNYSAYAKTAEEASKFIEKNFNWRVIAKKLEMYLGEIK